MPNNHLSPFRPPHQFSRGQLTIHLVHQDRGHNLMGYHIAEPSRSELISAVVEALEKGLPALWIYDVLLEIPTISRWIVADLPVRGSLERAGTYSLRLTILGA